MPKPPKTTVVIDTNVWLSGLIFGGLPDTILQLFIKNEITVVMSEELLSELRRKTIQKFPLYAPQLGLLELSLRQDAEWVKLGSQTVTVSSDPDDNKFIETAVLGGCGYIISGDKHLLDLKRYKNIKIITPAGFLKLI